MCTPPSKHTHPPAHPHVQVYRTPGGKISPEMAELRADMGSVINDKAVADYAGPLQVMQAFDGPLPETFNGAVQFFQQ